MGEVMIFRVTKEEMMERHEQVIPWLFQVYHRSHGEAHVEDFIHCVENGTYQCWAITEMGKWIGICLTEVVDYPQLSALKVIALAGSGLGRWKELLDIALLEFAREHGCRRIETVARPGFMKTLAKLGVKPAYVILIREVN